MPAESYEIAIGEPDIKRPGSDITIRALAELVMKVVGYEGRLTLDTSKPDGTPRKLLDVSSMRKLGWQARIPLDTGIANAYADFLKRF